MKSFGDTDRLRAWRPQNAIDGLASYLVPLEAQLSSRLATSDDRFTDAAAAPTGKLQVTGATCTPEGPPDEGALPVPRRAQYLLFAPLAVQQLSESVGCARYGFVSSSPNTRVELKSKGQNFLVIEVRDHAGDGGLDRPCNSVRFTVTVMLRPNFTDAYYWHDLPASLVP